MKTAIVALLAAVTAAFALLPSPALAQPELTEVDPPAGSAVDLPPDPVLLCYSEVIRGDFQVTYELPDGRPAGLTIAFLTNGRCLELRDPKLPEGAVGGEYTVRWNVTSQETNETAAGVLTYQVGEEGTPLPLPSPEVTPTPTPAGTPTPEGSPEVSPTPEPSPTPGETPTPEPSPSPTPPPDEGDDDGGPDILLVALLTTGAALGAAFVGVLLYVFRRRIGFDWHRPPEGGEGGPEQH